YIDNQEFKDIIYKNLKIYIDSI
ncbi:flavodoxin family protein, partial [Clostridioides difficile]